jgi:hypothetical protein
MSENSLTSFVKFYVLTTQRKQAADNLVFLFLLLKLTRFMKSFGLSIHYFAICFLRKVLLLQMFTLLSHLRNFEESFLFWLSESHQFWNTNFHRRLTKSCHLPYLNQFYLAPPSVFSFLFKNLPFDISAQYISHSCSLQLHLKNEFFKHLLFIRSCTTPLILPV